MLSFDKIRDSIASVNQQEIVLPITMKKCVVSPMTLSDETHLRTQIVNPGTYENEILKILFKRSRYINEEDAPIWQNFERFKKELSRIDKIALLWALYKASYSALYNQSVDCDKCGYTLEGLTLDLDSFIHEDTFKLWDKDKPFYEYTYPISVEYGNGRFTFEFTTVFPSIDDFNRVVQYLSADELAKNYRTLGMILKLPQLCAVFTKHVKFIDKKNPEEPESVETSDTVEILRLFSDVIPPNVAEEFLIEYNDHFSKYDPEFYTFVTCTECGNTIRYDIDMESEFFLRVLYAVERKRESSNDQAGNS